MEDEKREYVPTQIGWAIMATLFCCLPTGVVSIVHALKVDRLQTAGNLEGARESSRKARKWAFISLWIACAWWGLFFTVAIIGTIVSDSSNGNDELAEAQAAIEAQQRTISRQIARISGLNEQLAVEPGTQLALKQEEIERAQATISEQRTTIADLKSQIGSQSQASTELEKCNTVVRNTLSYLSYAFEGDTEAMDVMANQPKFAFAVQDGDYWIDQLNDRLRNEGQPAFLQELSYLFVTLTARLGGIVPCS